MDTRGTLSYRGEWRVVVIVRQLGFLVLMFTVCLILHPVASSINAKLPFLGCLATKGKAVHL
jgi:hypothetical protein